jgi:hypothetical protein
MRTKIMLSTVLVTMLAALASVTVAGAQPKALCGPPVLGNWTVAQSCTFQGQATAPGNVTVLAGVTLTLDPGANLNIDFAGHRLRVQAGARVIVKTGAKIR